MRNARVGHMGRPAPRPLGVWILTVSAALFAGVLPVFVALSLPGAGPLVWFSAALGLAIIAAAASAWQGSDQGRVVLLALVVLYYVLLAAGNFYAIRAGLMETEARERALTVGIRSALWIPIYLWYFLRPQTRAWYRQNRLP